VQPLYAPTGPQSLLPPPPPVYQVPPPPPPPAEPPPPPAPEPPAPPIQAYEEPVPQPFGQPAYQPIGQPVASPSVCPRCYAPLYAGATRCGNCGYETGAAWGTAPAAHGSSALPIALALLGVGCLVLAGAVFVVAQSGGSSATASPTAIAAATATPTAEPTPTPTASPTATPKASGGVGTPEPSPPFSWTSFTSPDGKWSTKFPGSSAPTKTITTTSRGTLSVTETVYAVLYAGVEYDVLYMDLDPSVVSGMDPEALLDQMEISLTSSADSTGVSTPSTVGTNPARDVSMTAAGKAITMRLFFVGSRFYALMVASDPGTAVYPQHFFAQFQLA
jgi:outer membrane biosynthesis protein TonB